MSVFTLASYAFIQIPTIRACQWQRTSGFGQETGTPKGSPKHEIRIIFDEIDRLGYTGWIGCEYRPERGTAPHATRNGLGWMPR